MNLLERVSGVQAERRDGWDKSEVRARSFNQLPDGSWYVTLWEELDTFGLDLEKPTTRKPDRKSFTRVNIKSLRAEDFPKGIFDGRMFLENARKEGARIRAN
jgi:hypothetical protein